MYIFDCWLEPSELIPDQTWVSTFVTVWVGDYVRLNTPLWDLMVAPVSVTLFEHTGKNLAAYHKQLQKTQSTKNGKQTEQKQEW